MLRLSICMMVKDEESNLPRCLESLNKLRSTFSNELIIIDTGSSDNTVNIAKQYTDKVYFHKWNNDFSEMRNKSISYATGEWLLIIDADEEVTDEADLIAFLHSNNKKWAGATLVVNNIVNAQGKIGTKINSVRIFKNGKNVKYSGKVHNMPSVSGDYMELKTNLMHYGYNSDDEMLMKRKFERTANLLLEELSKNPLNIYYRFQLGTSYDMYKEDSLALESYERAYNDIVANGLSMHEHLYVLGSYARSLVTMDYSERCIEVCLEGLKYEPDYLDLIYFCSMAYLKLERYDEGIAMANEYLEKLDDVENSNIASNISIQLYTLNSKAECLHNLAFAYKVLGEYHKTVQYAYMVIENETKDSPLYGNTVALAVEAGIKSSEVNKIIELYEVVGENNWPQIDELIAIHTEKEDSAYSWNELQWIAKTPYLLGDLYKSIGNEPLKVAGDSNRLINYGLELDVSAALLVALSGETGLKEVITANSNERLMKLIGRADEFSERFRDLALSRYQLLTVGGNYIEVNEKYILSKYLMIKAMGSAEQIQYFGEFIKSGMALLEKKYTIEFLISFDCLRFSSQEELFLIHVWHLQNSTGNSDGFVRSAMTAMPEWEKVFLIWLDDYLAQTEKKRKQISELVSALKAEVMKLMEEGCYNEALEIINEAMTIVPNSIEFLALKSDLVVKLNVARN